jgi:hypothetical protein
MQRFIKRFQILMPAGVQRVRRRISDGPMTTSSILQHALWLEEVDPGFLAEAILVETGEDYGGRDVLDQVARLIEIFGLAGVARIVGCPR